MRRIGIGAVGSTSIAVAAPALLSELASRGETGMPERYSFYEPIKNTFQGVRETLDAWLNARQATLYLVRKKRVQYAATFADRRAPRLGSIVFSFAEKDVHQDDMTSLLRRTCEVMNPDLAYLHWGSDIEIQRRLGDSTLRSNSAPNGVYTEDVTLGPKTLFWATYFGPRYVERFGRELVLSLPTEKTEELLGGVLLQLSPSLKYDDAEYEILHNRRLDCIRRLGREFFRDGEFVKQAFATADAPWIPPRVIQGTGKRVARDAPILGEAETRRLVEKYLEDKRRKPQ